MRIASMALVAAAFVAVGSPDLDRAEELVALGEFQEAREIVERWWTLGPEDAPRNELQQALYLRGRLTIDGRMAEADYRRLVVEFPGGPYSARALLRLGLSAYAQGDLLQAARHFESLASDYSSAPERLRARDWLERYEEAVELARAAREGEG